MGICLLNILPTPGPGMNLILCSQLHRSGPSPRTFLDASWSNVNFLLCSKLQSDLKTTKVEEMKIQLETCYKEILRLSTAKQAGAITAWVKYFTTCRFWDHFYWFWYSPGSRPFYCVMLCFRKSRFWSFLTRALSTGQADKGTGHKVPTWICSWKFEFEYKD